MIRSLVLVLLCALLGAAGVQKQDSADPSTPVKIVMLGTSLTAGYGLPAGQGLAAQLGRALAAQDPDVTLVDAGVSGDTSAGGLARLDWALADGGDAVIVELGSNDALRGLAPEETERNLAAILERLEARGLPVLLTGMKAPRNLGADYAARFDAIYPRLAARYPVQFYPFLLEGVAADLALNQADGIHPNPDGVARIVAGLEPLAETLVKKARSRN